MAYGRWRSFKPRKARVEIIPLIDVMFLLLCFFVYATMNMVVQQGIFVDLASSKSSSAVERSKFVVVSVDAEGTFYLDKKPMSRIALEDALRGIKNLPEFKSIILNADKEAKHGQVVKLLDMIRKSGVKMAIFAVEPQA